MLSERDIKGSEYDFLATNSLGQVAVFATAGAGCPPSGLLRAVDEHRVAIDALTALPVSCAVVRCDYVATELGFPDTWRLVAERGVFGYDAIGRKYIYVCSAVPSVPINVRDLPDSIRRVALSVVFQGLVFSPHMLFGEDEIRASVDLSRS